MLCLVHPESLDDIMTESKRIHINLSKNINLYCFLFCECKCISYMNKNYVFTKPMSLYNLPEALLICSSRVAMSSPEDEIGGTSWLSLIIFSYLQ